jgi:hypothetical protein
MPYRVRSPDGELDFPDMADIAQAYAAGLVDPDDEVLEAGATTWRKARSLPFLAGTKAQQLERERAAGRAQSLNILLAAFLGALSLYLMFFREGHARTLGFVLAIALAFQMTRIVSRTWRKPS